jgi:hypothetical protein
LLVQREAAVTTATKGPKEVESVQRGPFTRSRRKLSLTPELFGKLLVLIWGEQHGKSDLADRDAVIQALLDATDTAPDSVRSVMHIEDRISGPSIAEYTQYMVAAQDDGLLKRYNPAYVRCHVEVQPSEAEYLLESYEEDFASELAWLRERVRQLKYPQEA